MFKDVILKRPLLCYFAGVLFLHELYKHMDCFSYWTVMCLGTEFLLLRAFFYVTVNAPFILRLRCKATD